MESSIFAIINQPDLLQQGYIDSYFAKQMAN